MQQDFLNHIWQYRKFDCSDLKTDQGEKLQILHPGHYLQKTDSIFFNAQLLIGSLRWAGSVAVHLKVSDWDQKHERTIANRENVILLVVYEYDAGIILNIPVLELKSYLTQDLIERSQEAGVEKIIKFVTDLWD